jgi:hypothetical protein
MLVGVAPSVLLHFSEDPSIEVFRPHVPATREAGHEPLVWAIDEDHAPLYWFPRECPRVTWWPPGEPSRRTHAVEWAWLDRVRATRLFAYSFDPDSFERWPDAVGHWVSRATVVPVGVSPVGDLLERHASAGIELRLVPNLWALHRWVVASGCEFSSVRLANAQPEEPTSLT